jgi:tight adherence protein B
MILALIVVFVLLLLLRAQRQQHLKRFNEGMPKALELIIFALRAGHSFEQGLDFASRKLDAPLGRELRRCVEQVELGQPLPHALQNLVLRNPHCRPLHCFVEAVLLLKQTGGNLVEVLEKMVTSLRAQVTYEARFRALTAEGRLSGIILSALPPFIWLLVLLLEPQYLSILLVERQGQLLLMVGLGLWALGMVWLLRLLRPGGLRREHAS